jgi:hypothetical protein
MPVMTCQSFQIKLCKKTTWRNSNTKIITLLLQRWRTRKSPRTYLDIEPWLACTLIPPPSYLSHAMVKPTSVMIITWVILRKVRLKRSCSHIHILYRPSTPNPSSCGEVSLKQWTTQAKHKSTQSQTSSQFTTTISLGVKPECDPEISPRTKNT